MFGLEIRTKVLTDLIPKGESGKTEGWVVLDVDPGCRIYAGLKSDTTVEEWLSLKQHLKERRPCESLSSICHLSPPWGSIWPSTSFKSIALMLWGVSWSPNRSGATSCWSSSLRCRLAWWGLRPPGRRIIGRAS